MAPSSRLYSRNILTGIHRRGFGLYCLLSWRGGRLKFLGGLLGGLGLGGARGEEYVHTNKNKDQLDFIAFGGHVTINPETLLRGRVLFAWVFISHGL